MAPLRVLLCLVLALAVSAFQAPSQLAASKVARASSPAMMAAKKKAPAKKSSSSGRNSRDGKGGIFPWITNEAGTYAKPLMLSSQDFLGADGDKWIGWGFVPNSVKKLYNRGGRKGLL
jgi:hypothetical protein